MDIVQLRRQRWELLVELWKLLVRVRQFQLDVGRLDGPSRLDSRNGAAKFGRAAQARGRGKSCAPARTPRRLELSVGVQPIRRSAFQIRRSTLSVASVCAGEEKRLFPRVAGKLGC